MTCANLIGAQQQSGRPGVSLLTSLDVAKIKPGVAQKLLVAKGEPRMISPFRGDQRPHARQKIEAQVLAP